MNGGETEKTKELMQTNGKYVYMNTPERTTENVARRAIVFRTMNSITKKIENMPMNEIDEILASIPDEIKFVTRVCRYDIVEVQFED